ncbi:unnamed protein product [Trichogramma brassicae]|uniref:Uncharacterized protein n=1 Tax=Trichogramma brassicae TaxID=86971 RepID=A0A6H5IXP9_9HYME|nr:unnamed protein product [Trichogramma brassicae]
MSSLETSYSIPYDEWKSLLKQPSESLFCKKLLEALYPWDELKRICVKQKVKTPILTPNGANPKKSTRISVHPRGLLQKAARVDRESTRISAESRVDRLRISEDFRANSRRLRTWTLYLIHVRSTWNQCPILEESLYDPRGYPRNFFQLGAGGKSGGAPRDATRVGSSGRGDGISGSEPDDYRRTVGESCSVSDEDFLKIYPKTIFFVSRSLKTKCPFLIRVIAPIRSNSVVIRQLCSTHNHMHETAKECGFKSAKVRRFRLVEVCGFKLVKVAMCRSNEKLQSARSGKLRSRSEPVLKKISSTANPGLLSGESSSEQLQLSPTVRPGRPTRGASPGARHYTDASTGRADTRSVPWCVALYRRLDRTSRHEERPLVRGCFYLSLHLFIDALTISLSPSASIFRTST